MEERRVNVVRFSHHNEAIWWYLFGVGQAIDHWAYQTSAPRQSAARNFNYTNEVMK